MKKLIFNIPEKQSVSWIESRLKQRLRIQSQPPERVTRIYMDTCDWRVYSKGDVVETTKSKSGLWFTWRSRQSDQIHAGQTLDQVPAFAWNLSGDALMRRMKHIIGVRALLPVATVYSRVHSMRVLNNHNKTILRMEIQIDDPCSVENPQKHNPSTIIAKRIHLFPLRGYNTILNETCRFLKQQCRLKPVVEDPQISTFTYLNITPVVRKNNVGTTDPDQRGDISVKTIFRQLLLEMENNESGLRGDIDSEYLHDYRVAIRRTRTLLTQAHGLLPQRSLNKYKRDFAWLGMLTGPVRDLDVYLLFFDAFTSSLPIKLREDITPLYEFLSRHKQSEHRKLNTLLSGARYLRLKQDWRKFIDSPPPAHSTLPFAQQPTVEFANRRIWRLYRNAVRQGSVITMESPANTLHELRKTCKKLRYMNEFFQNFYQKKQLSKLIKALKNLQNNLGEFQDLKVQEESLRNFILDMEHESGISSKTRDAINHLINNFKHRERLVRAEFEVKFRQFASSKNKQIYKKIYTSPVAIIRQSS